MATKTLTWSWTLVSKATSTPLKALKALRGRGSGVNHENLVWTGRELRACLRLCSVPLRISGH